MANSWYIPLVIIETLHDFYAGGKSADFQLIPTTSCKQLMANLGMLFRSTPYGALVGLRVTEEAPGGLFRPFVPFDASFKLSFYLSLQNQYAVNFSNLPQDKTTSQSYYLSNRFNKQVSSNLILSGHAGPLNRLAAEDLVQVIPDIFKYRLSTPGALATITNAFSGAAVWPTPQDPQGPGEVVECKLSNAPDGRYHLQEDNGFSIELYKDNTLAARQYFGVVELFSDAPPADFQLTAVLPDATTGARPRRFAIRLAPRASRWRYFVIAKTEGLLAAQVALSNGPSTPVFNNLPVDPQLEAKYGVGKVEVWQSAADIPFQENPEEEVNYQLGTRNGRLGFPPMAEAHPEMDAAGNLIVDPSGDPVFFSDKIIHF